MKTRNNDALFILRTPLQACIARQVIWREGVIEYDLVYLTQQDSEEDRHYFSVISADASFARYVFVPPKKYDILNHLGFRISLKDCFRDFDRKYVVIGSIDSPIVSALAATQKSSILLTVDDGTANISSFSRFHDEKRSWRYLAYAKALGAEPLSNLKYRIERHYSIYQGFDNIVEQGRLCNLESIASTTKILNRRETIRYFIGQPVRLGMREEAAKAIQKILAEYNIDLYVRHPREEKPMNFSTSLLNKAGRIAEEAILNHAAGRQVEIYSGFSSATLNLARFVRSAHVFIYLRTSSRNTREYIRLARMAGCSVHFI